MIPSGSEDMSSPASTLEGTTDNQRWSRSLALILFAVVVAILIIASFYWASPTQPESPGIEVDVFAEGLEVPWSLAFAPDGRLFVTERPGRIRVVESGVLKEEPLVEIEVSTIEEAGMLGLALHPNFSRNGYVYVYYTYESTDGLTNRIVRLAEQGDRLVEDTTILDGIPGAPIHNGGRLKFGPDGKLYATTGDSAEADLAQDLDSLAGKILRLSPDGSIPEDNPFPASPVYSLGHRNPQGIDWQRGTDVLLASEHGSSGHDEINRIEPGENYGWPLITGDEEDPRFVSPLYHTGASTLAPSGIAIYDGQKLPWDESLLVTGLRGAQLRVFNVSRDTDPTVTSYRPLFQGVYGRLRDVIQGPDGLIYFSTSNRDGRGSPSPEDDRVLVIRPDGGSSNLSTQHPLTVLSSAVEPSLRRWTMTARVGKPH